MTQQCVREEVLAHLESLGFVRGEEYGIAVDLSHKDSYIFGTLWGADELQLETPWDQIYTNLRSSEFSDVRDAATSCLELLFGTTQRTKRSVMESEDLLLDLIERSKQREG